MTIITPEKTYTVIRQIPGDVLTTRYLCRLEETDMTAMVIGLKDEALIRDNVDFLARHFRQGSDAGSMDCFYFEETLCVAFPFKDSVPLSKVMERDDLSFERRLAMARSILAKLAPFSTSDYLMWDALDPANISFTDDLESFLQFKFRRLKSRESFNFKSVQKRFAEIFEKIFAKELIGGSSPESSAYLSLLRKGEYQTFQQLFNGFLRLEKAAPLTLSMKNAAPGNSSGGTRSELPLLHRAALAAALALAIIALLCYIFSTDDKPADASDPLTQTIVAGSEKALSYTGRARLLDGSIGGRLIYEGMMEGGLYEGSGVLYHKTGEKHYVGAFSSGLFEGAGRLYYKNGKVKYAGSFSGGKFDGNGELHDKQGALRYKGGFIQGLRSGRGGAYSATGQLVYLGDFENDEINGKGKRYRNDKMVYRGAFAGGKYEGFGRKYDPETGVTLYEGTFHDGLFNGDGKRFNKDGALIYEGGFVLGRYSGLGRLYDPRTGLVAREGIFSEGRLLTETTPGYGGVMWPNW